MSSFPRVLLGELEKMYFCSQHIALTPDPCFCDLSEPVGELIKGLPLEMAPLAPHPLSDKELSELGIAEVSEQELPMISDRDGLSWRPTVRMGTDGNYEDEQPLRVRHLGEMLRALPERGLLAVLRHASDPGSSLRFMSDALGVITSLDICGKLVVHAALRLAERLRESEALHPTHFEETPEAGDGQMFCDACGQPADELHPATECVAYALNMEAMVTDRLMAENEQLKKTLRTVHFRMGPLLMMPGAASAELAAEILKETEWPKP